MLKNTVVKFVVAVALLAAVAGVDVVGEPIFGGFSSEASACSTGGTGGGC